ncbi:hypothetical protein KC19_9G125400 [Ceratodon purpureus]|uniref:Secreted protein n=1 Tax=Ceratodon purpureus TaxID=3225 RepID=A0A8T0GRB6_CERPU|nr:hypothetical protein KC19_9G125400 [Ceratodon purpureus]
MPVILRHMLVLSVSVTYVVLCQCVCFWNSRTFCSGKLDKWTATECRCVFCGFMDVTSTIHRISTHEFALLSHWGGQFEREYFIMP